MRDQAYKEEGEFFYAFISLLPAYYLSHTAAGAAREVNPLITGSPETPRARPPA